MADHDQTSGLLKPLVGKDAVHIKCQRCGEQGHTDRECPLYLQGNKISETFRYMHEDPMHDYFEQRKIRNKEDRINQLQAILDASTSSDSDSDSHSSSSSGEEKKKKKRRHKRQHKEHKDKRRKSDESETHLKKKNKDKKISKKRRKSKHKSRKSL